MQTSPITAPLSQQSDMPVDMRFVLLISAIAALGGLLFGYDWVVIGGAKPFYEAYFRLSADAQIGWANSCALIGCFAGSLLGGRCSDFLGRKRVLGISAALFAVSSLLTGEAHLFSSFIAWRILGGVAIGLASNVSPTYIAEISPAAWRGRLVSFNQLAIVIGILLAQVVNWRIARPVPAEIDIHAMFLTWNVQSGWRWMFIAVSVPSLLLLAMLPLIPESPRWLVAQGNSKKAQEILKRIGGQNYSQAQVAEIEGSIGKSIDTVHWSEILRGRIGQLLLIGIALAVLQQCSGINVLFNYAEEIYRSAGYGVNEILVNIVITGAINLVFTVIAMLLVDKIGRRKLMFLGCLSVAACHLCASVAYRMHLHGIVILILTLMAIACYSMTLAPVTWVLITELFPTRYRATAVSISVASLWVASFALTYTFPVLQHRFGPSGSFLVYGTICLLGAVFVYFAVPETAGQSLEHSAY